MNDHCEYAHWDGAYVLGALTDSDREVFEAHMVSCRVCQIAVAELAPIPGILGGTVSTSVPTSPEVVPLAAARRRRHRRRWTAGLLGAAALIGAVTLTITFWPTQPAGQAKAVVALASTANPAITAKAGLESAPWGTRIELTCEYPADDGEAADDPAFYVLVVTDSTGRDSQISTWNAVPGRTISLAAATALPADKIQSISIQTSSGKTLFSGQP